MAPIAHWDEVEREREEVGPLASWTTDLGTATGSASVGVTRWQVDPGKRSTPAHIECDEEEIFYVLGGSGLSWQDGETYEVREGDCLVHLVGEEAHTLVAGADGLDVLAFGQRTSPTLTYLPRAGVARMGVTVDVSQGPHPWEREAAAGELELPPPSRRPDRIVALADVPALEFGPGETVQAVRRDLGRAAGSVRTGIKHVSVAAGKLACPPHCHSAEEEIFVVLDGSGVLLLGDEELPVRRGHVVARPPGTRVAHSFRAGQSELSLLAYGTREANDITYYPRSGKVYWRGVGLVGRIEPLDYWDGEG